MICAQWPCPLPAGGVNSEMALVAEGGDHMGGAQRLLVIPALLGEANQMRGFTVEVMRRLCAAGITCMLPDLPGTNESLSPLEAQTPSDWQHAMAGAAAHFGATHVLTIRGGALLAPSELPGWRYAPCTGATQLRHLLRTRIVAAREAGIAETQDGLLALGRAEGLDLAGLRLSADFITEFLGRVPDAEAPHREISQEALGCGGGLWLRAEPGEDAAQADALAAIVAMALADERPA